MFTCQQKSSDHIPQSFYPLLAELKPPAIMMLAPKIKFTVGS
jgi:hypothetical protein